MTEPLAEKSDAKRARGRPSGEDSEEIHRKLRNVALRHFLTYGLDGASIVAISRESGVSRQLIHRRFGDKQQFFNEITSHRQGLFFANSRMALEDHGSPYLVFLDLGRRMADNLLAKERIDLARVMYGALYRFGDIMAVERAALDRALAIVATYLQHILADHGITDVDPREAARDFRSLINGLVTPVILGIGAPPPPDELDMLLDGIVRRFLRGLGLPDESEASDAKTQPRGGKRRD